MVAENLCFEFILVFSVEWHFCTGYERVAGEDFG